jgi:hypothetical protein
VNCFPKESKMSFPASEVFEMVENTQDSAETITANYH